MAPEGIGRGETVLHGDADALAREAGSAAGRHVAVLSDHDVDEWHRTLNTTPGATDDRHFVKVGGQLRGATAAGGIQTRPMGPNLHVTVVEEEALDGAMDATVAIDAPETLLDAVDDAEAGLDALVDAAREVASSIHATVPETPAYAAALTRRFDPVDERCRELTASAGVEHLRETDPTNFGYLRSNWREARRGLAAVDMTYPQAKQIHEAIPDPTTTPRTLGAALQAFVELGALDVWGDTVAANRYDMTAYDPEQAAAIGEVVAGLEDE
jgi:hypothetical protein